MLGGVPADAVDAVLLECADHGGDLVLDIGILTVQIGHADVFIDDVAADLGILVRALIVKILGSAQAAVNSARP